MCVSQHDISHVIALHRQKDRPVAVLRLLRQLYVQQLQQLLGLSTTTLECSVASQKLLLELQCICQWLCLPKSGIEIGLKFPPHFQA